MENLQVAEGLSIDNNAGFGYYPGDIIMLNSNTIPAGFLSCNGATITQESYPALFSILGTYYDSAGIICKLPNLNSQAEWHFPCGTIGNAASYGGSNPSHSHATSNQTVTSSNYSTVAHNHTSSNNSNNTATNHNHTGSSGSVGANNSSTTANRSNGSGQGANLAIVGHTHSYNWSLGGSVLADANHYHSSSITTACAAADHSHSATLSTSNVSSSYVPDNAIAMRYYIKW